MIYKPAEDSIFFADFLKDYISNLKDKANSLTYLDMGCGSGILSQTVLDCGVKKENILAVDIDQESVDYVKEKISQIKVIKSNLFQQIPQEQKFDLISFNAPYLPEDSEDKEPQDSKLATTGGKLGDEISIEFLKQAKSHLNPSGRILLLVSSLTPFNKINKFRPRVVARQKIFFEELMILEIE